MPAQAALPGIEVIGIDVHIGSQLTDLEPFEIAYTKVADLTRQLREDGHDIRRLDLGGGLGIPYERSNSAPPLPLEYGDVIRRTVGDLGVEVEIEPGRLISGNAGLLVSGVIYVKKGDGRDFLILDAAMNDLIRPAMYGAWHDIVPVVEPAPGPRTGALRHRRAGLRDRRYLCQTTQMPPVRRAIWSPSAPPGPMAR
jgi:diaminopimelate decarboxylase